MAIVIVLLVFLVIFIIFFAVLRILGGGNFPWVQFYSRGKDAGFAFSEIHLLRRVAVASKLKKPTALFWSVELLDKCIKDIIGQQKREKRENQPEAQTFLGKLYHFRKKVEFAKPKYTTGLKSTREIDPHQKVKITHPDTGTCYSQIVENLRKHIAFAHPQGPNVPEDFSWKEKQVSVYFWRKNDAGYYFETKVLGEFMKEGLSILHANHSENVIRSQKRKSVRAYVSAPANIYKLPKIESANERQETKHGLRCRLQDISEDGASFVIGGRAKVGMAVKLQFSLSDQVIILCGIVKGVSYNAKKGQSTLHMQAVPPSVQMRNRILAFVYNIFNEQDDLAKKELQKRRIRQAQQGKKTNTNVKTANPAAAKSPTPKKS